MNLRTKFTALLLIASTAGCSCFVPWNQRVSITCSDPIAKISVDNRPVGVGHVEVDLPRNKGHLVTATVGNKSASVTLGNQISVTGVLDIIGGVSFGLPFIGCFFPGFWDVSEPNLHISMPG